MLFRGIIPLYKSRVLTNTSSHEGGEVPSLDELRKKLTPAQKKLLEELWRHFFDNVEWPPTRSIFSRHGKSSVLEELKPLTGNVLFESPVSNGQNGFALTLLGALLTERGERFQKLMAQLFEMQREVFRNEPDKASISSVEIADALILSGNELKILGLLVRVAQISGGYTNGANPTWTISTMAEAEDFPPHGSLYLHVENWALRFYQPDIPVFKEDRKYPSPTYLTTNDPELAPHAVADHSESNDGNPLKKRYQVFVSSTYEDLIEERKHVIQALLATKCIPSGMELFPATSTKQWKLITSVIDDCDYYVLIIAGKYGSIGTKKKSYTEMEFDYALEKGKSVLAFIHRNIGSLLMTKCEDSDQRRTALSAFTEKVKGSMTCQFWNTPDGLASEIKTAVLHAIEADPKPGWVRSTEVPSWKMVSGLKERISELEGIPLTKKAEDVLPEGQQILSFSANMTWRETNEPHRHDSEKQEVSLNLKIKMTWDFIFLFLPLEAGKSTSKNGLKTRFYNSLTKLCKTKLQKKTTMIYIVDVRIQFEPDLFDKVFQTFVARNYFFAVSVRPGSWASRKKTHYKLTPTGIRKMAECKSSKLNQTAHAVVEVENQNGK